MEGGDVQRITPNVTRGKISPVRRPPILCTVICIYTSISLFRVADSACASAMMAATVEPETQLKECQADLRACEEALKHRTDELAACRSERDALLVVLKKLRCSVLAPWQRGGRRSVTVTPC